MDADKQQNRTPMNVFQLFVVSGVAGNGGFAAMKNLRSSESICG
jgi:hypothetical protein